MTLDEGLDPVDGSENSLARRTIMADLARTDDDLTDAEIVSRATDDFWYIDLCVDQLHRLPSEVDPILTCREYTHLQAYSLVKRTLHKLAQKKAKNNAHPGV